MFSPTETLYYMMKGKVTVRSNAWMRIGSAQLDDDNKAVPAGERDGRNIHSTNTRLVELVSILEKS